jgi:hypothetical protein
MYRVSAVTAVRREAFDLLGQLETAPRGFGASKSGL